MAVQILNGDCREVLRTLPDESVHCVVTSPPYWGLRDYGVDGQIGLEASAEVFVDTMVEVFADVHRVLRGDGTLWLNLGDSYASQGGPGWQGKNGQRADRRFTLVRDTVPMREVSRRAAHGLKPKDLVGAPWRIAFALQADGWYLRQDIIWSKPNPMPESVRDRCTKAHEYLFLLSKSERYYFDQEAIREESEYQPLDILPPAGWMIGKGSHTTIHPDGRTPYAERTKRRAARTKDELNPERKRNGEDGLAASFRAITPTRNKRSVWTVPTAPFGEAHFATFPPDLIEPCILAGCPKGGTVLDPFGGAGTTGLVADRLGRNAILIELNPEYAAMAERRLRGDAGMFADVTKTAL
jgi:DNA modification methylase